MVGFISNVDARYFLFSDVSTLKLSMIILPTYQPIIILPTARTSKKISSLRLHPSETTNTKKRKDSVRPKVQ